MIYETIFYIIKKMEMPCVKQLNAYKVNKRVGLQSERLFAHLLFFIF